jgi:ATP-dependent Clp protease protease subunit
MKVVTVYITGPIVAESSADFAKMMGVFSMATVRAEVEAVPDATDVLVIINSCGGSFTEGFAIHDYLRGLKMPIKTKVVGQCASIATVPMLAGDVREITANSDFTIHNPWLDPWNMGPMEADDLFKLAAEVKEAETKLLNFYAERTGIDVGLIEPLMKEDTTLTADRAKELKFVTEIVDAYEAQASVSKQENFCVHAIN